MEISSVSLLVSKCSQRELGICPARGVCPQAFVTWRTVTAARAELREVNNVYGDSVMLF